MHNNYDQTGVPSNIHFLRICFQFAFATDNLNCHADRTRKLKYRHHSICKIEAPSTIHILVNKSIKTKFKNMITTDNATENQKQQPSIKTEMMAPLAEQVICEKNLQKGATTPHTSNKHVQTNTNPSGYLPTASIPKSLYLQFTPNSNV